MNNNCHILRISGLAVALAASILTVTQVASSAETGGEDTWTQLADMPTARYALATCVVDGMAPMADAQNVSFVCDHDPSNSNHTFAFEQVVSVSIDVQNTGGAGITPIFAYSFIVTDGNDTNADGLPEDFQDLLDPFPSPSDDARTDLAQPGSKRGGIRPRAVAVPSSARWR